MTQEKKAMQIRKTRWRRFDCPECGEKFHIVKRVRSGAVYGGTWIRYMPPAYCPACGAKTEE